MNIRANLDNFIHRICSLRSVTLFVTWICMLDIELGVFREEASALGVKDTFVILPFVQTDMYFSKVILLGVLCFFSNAPFMDKSEMYVISRIGRKRWGMRNIQYIFFCRHCSFAGIGLFQQPYSAACSKMEQRMGKRISYAFRDT